MMPLGPNPQDQRQTEGGGINVIGGLSEVDVVVRVDDVIVALLIAEGFEGDAAKDGPKAGQRTVNGWKNAGLPWTYKLDKAKMYFPR